MRGSWWRKRAAVLGPHRHRVDDEQVFGANDGDDLERIPGHVSCQGSVRGGDLSSRSLLVMAFSRRGRSIPADPVLES